VRVAVLPRDKAALVITSAMAIAVRICSVANLALTIPLLFDALLSRGLSAALPIPLTILLVMLALSIVTALKPRPWLVGVFLAAGAIGAVVFQLSLLAADPGLYDDAFFLLNRPAISLVLVAVGATTWLAGLIWILIGFATSTLASVAVAIIAAQPVRTGWGPILMFTFYVVAYSVLARIQALQRQRVPDFEELDVETRRHATEEALRDRVSAAVHDTLLNDLAFVMNSPDALDERAVTRLREDLSILRGAEWLRTSAELTTVDDVDAELRNQILMVVSDMQWRGLSVRVTGSGTAVRHLTVEASHAVIAATRACLENVLRHSGETTAEIDLSYGPEDVTIIIADEGSGFIPESVPDDRLGVRQSIVNRITAVGGSVKIWSAPGAGTSIVMRVPAQLVEREAADAPA